MKISKDAWEHGLGIVQCAQMFGSLYMSRIKSFDNITATNTRKARNTAKGETEEVEARSILLMCERRFLRTLLHLFLHLVVCTEKRTLKNGPILHKQPYFEREKDINGPFFDSKQLNFLLLTGLV